MIIVAFSIADDDSHHSNALSILFIFTFSKDQIWRKKNQFLYMTCKLLEKPQQNLNQQTELTPVMFV